MSQIIIVSSPKVKPTRRTVRTSSRFGAGILPFVPFVGVMPYTPQDLADAAQMFAGNASNPDWDAMTTEAAYYDQVEHYRPGQPTEDELGQLVAHGTI